MRKSKKKKKKKKQSGAHRIPATRGEGKIKMREYCSSQNIHSTTATAAFEVPVVPNSGNDATMARLRKHKQMAEGYASSRYLQKGRSRNHGNGLLPPN